jgi:prepilin-type N-terminal cleavage/methylation domain-containing protein
MAFSRLHSSFSQTGRKAFSLTELLVTLLVTGIIMGAVLGAMTLFLSNFQFISSGVSARQRAEMVLSVLAKPIQHAGLGMPVTSDDFQTAFDQV